jgi:hypothetical protein
MVGAVEPQPLSTRPIEAANAACLNKLTDLEFNGLEVGVMEKPRGCDMPKQAKEV